MPYENKGRVGKIRRKAYRLHQTLSNPQDSVREIEDLPKPLVTQESLCFKTINSTTFKNVHIPTEALKQKLPSYSKKDERNLDVKSAISQNSVINSIKGRRKKIPFHEVVASAKDFLKKREAQKKKEKAFILNDLQALQAALPTLEEKGQKKDKPRASKSFAQQNTEMMEDLQAYHQCLARPEFEIDAFSALTNIVKEHLKS